MKKLYKQISIFVVLTIIFNMITIKVNAADTSKNKTQSTNLTQQGDKKESKIVSEVIDKRDKNIKQFQREDGSFEAVVYSQPVHYLVNGKWEDIDNTLSDATDDDSSTVLQNNKNDFKVKFAKDASSNKLVKLDKDKYEISWGVEGAQKSEPQVKAKDQKAEDAANDKIAQKTIDTKYKDKSAKDKDDIKRTLVANEQKETLDKVKSDVNYANILPNTDINYVLNGDSVKENIIIKEKMDNPQFTFDINVKNLKAKLNADNTVIFYDEKDSNKVLYNFEIPFMYDAKGDQCNDIKVSLNETKKGYTLTITPDNSWLNDSTRSYPITLDPPVETSLGINDIQDTFVCSIDTSDKYNNILTRVGYMQNIGVMRTYLKFTLPQLTPADMVTNATLNIYTDSTQNGGAQVNAHKVLNDWSSYGLSWNSKPAYNSKIEDYNIINASGWNYFDITSIAKDWYNTGNNFGLMLKADNEAGGNVAFRSSDTTDSNARPSVTINYSSNVGLENYWTFHSQDVGRAGTGFVNNYNGNLVFQHNDLSMSGNRMPVNITHTYNLKEAVSNIDIGYGIGWRLNLSQTVTTLNAADGLYYVYTDEDGTKHYFKSDSTGTFKDNEGVDLTLTKNGDGSYTIKDKKSNQLNFGSDGYLNNVKDSNNNTLTLNYTTVNNNKRLGSVTDGAGRVTILQLDVSGRLNAIVDPSGRKVSYGYNGSQLTTVTDPDTKVSSYAYDSGNKLLNITKYDGYKISYSYLSNLPYRVNDISESNTDGTQGGELGISYGNNITKFLDKVKNKQDIYTFNNYGNTISVQDDAGNAKYYKYDDINNVNKLTTESKLQSTVINLLNNHNMESDSDWNFANDGVSTSTGGFTTAEKYLGQRSVMVSKTNNVNRGYNQQYLALEKGKTYTYSGYIKTNGISNTNAQGANLLVHYKNNAGAWLETHSDYVSGTNDWARYEVTFTIPADASSADVIIRTAVTNETGTGYFDALQLEVGSIANRYNLIQNGDFSGSGTVPPGWWNNNLGTGEGLVVNTDSDHPKVLDSTVLKVNGVYGVNKGIGEAVYLTGVTGDTFDLSAWAKGDSVPHGAFDIRAAFVQSSGSASWVNLHFNRDGSNWQYLNDIIKAPTSYVRIDIYIAYENNANSAYFDGIQLYKEEFGDSYQYDSNGNLISTADLAKQNSSFAYNTTNDLVASTDPKGNQFKYEYDSKHNITKATSAENVVYSFTYDSSGNPLTSKVGDSTLFMNSSASYTSSGNYLNSLTDSSGNTVKYNWDETKGLLTSTTDANNKTTSNTYDSNTDNLLSTAKTVDGQQVTNNYAYSNDKISSITQNGFNYNFGYDSFGNNTTVAVGNQNLITNSFEARTGKLLQSNYGNGQIVSNTYDEQDRVIAKNYNGNARYKYSYNASSNVGYQQDLVNNNNFKYIFDFANRLVQVKDSLGNLTNFGYDSNNNKNKITEKINGNNYDTSYGFDKDNKLTSITYNRSNANSVALGYDTLSRLTNKTVNTGTVNYNTSYGYLPGTNGSTTTKLGSITNNGSGILYTYDKNGNVETITQNGQVIKYYYNELNEVIREDNQVLNKTITTTYDVGGNITSKTEYPYTNGTPSGATRTYPYTYGDTNWKDKLTNFDGKAISYDAIGNPLTYNGWSFNWEEGRQLQSMTGNGYTISYKYNDEGIRTSKTLNGFALDQFALGDVNGDGKVDLVAKGRSGTASAGYVYIAFGTGAGFGDWSWNSGSRMIDDNSPFFIGDVNGDGKADLITKGQAGASNAGVVYVGLSTGMGFQGWSWNSGSRMLDDNSPFSVGDVNGDGKADLITKGQAGASNAGVVYVGLSTGMGFQGWSWNSGSRMIDDNSPFSVGDVNGDGKVDLITKGQDGGSIAGGNNEGYVYVGLSTGTTFQGWSWNSQKNMFSNNGTTNYYLVGDKVTYEENGTDKIYYTYDSAGHLVSMNLNSVEYYYIFNAQGDVIGLFDKTGAQVVSYVYDTWGKLISTTGSLASTVGAKNPYLYRSYRYDSETGLYYLQSRYYNPDWGRFINCDDIGGKVGQLLSHNAFAYCGNNPIMRADSNGHDWLDKLVNRFCAWVTGTSYEEPTETQIELSGFYSQMQANEQDFAMNYQLLMEDAARAAASSDRVSEVIDACEDVNCFTAGTQIQTKDGSKSIEDVKPGDEVYSENPDAGEKGYKKVLQTFVHETDTLVHVSIGDTKIDTTEGHRFWVVDKGWTYAKDLKIGDKLLQSSGSIIAITKLEVEHLKKPIKIYNFEVQDWHTYFVSGLSILVHNECTLPTVYRGGDDLMAKSHEVKINKETGLLKTTHGISVNTNADKVAKFGGAFKVSQVPEGLSIIQRGADPGHYEIVPSKPMLMQEYQGLLNQIKLFPTD